MTVKANLRVVLLANDVTVAESEDAMLWQRTLAAVTGQHPLTSQVQETTIATSKVASIRPNGLGLIEPGLENASESIELFAREVGLDIATIEGACDPISEPPYIQLDVRAWQEFKRNTPDRGAKSIPAIVVAATLLVLWSKKIGLNPVTISQAQAVLHTIDIRDKNAARALKNCDWLQTRDDNIKLNPARYNEALGLARAFCSRQQIEAW